MKICNECNSNSVSEFAEDESLKYKDGEITVALSYSICGNCNREFISKDQILDNELKIREAKKVFNGLMSSQEIIASRQKLGLTQKQAAQAFGGGQNAFSKYERGEVSQTKAMDTLIRICLKHRDIFDEVLSDNGLAQIGTINKTVKAQIPPWAALVDLVATGNAVNISAEGNISRKISGIWSSKIGHTVTTSSYSEDFGENANVA